MKYIEQGWNSYRKLVIPANAPEIQIKECRQAFFGGSAILMQSIMLMLDPGVEPTDADMQRMSDIQKELDEYGQSLDRAVFGK